jgi:hypothetical protein
VLRQFCSRHTAKKRFFMTTWRRFEFESEFVCVYIRVRPGYLCVYIAAYTVVARGITKDAKKAFKTANEITK